MKKQKANPQLLSKARVFSYFLPHPPYLTGVLICSFRVNTELIVA